jgi:hypothetical protein
MLITEMLARNARIYSDETALVERQSMIIQKYFSFFFYL